jgi:hypothetical protein
MLFWAASLAFLWRSRFSSATASWRGLQQTAYQCSDVRVAAKRSVVSIKQSATDTLRQTFSPHLVLQLLDLCAQGLVFTHLAAEKVYGHARLIFDAVRG